MKKYLIFLLITILYSCSNKNEFANHRFKVVSVAELVTLYGAEVRYPREMDTSKTLIWDFTDSEVQVIIYNDQNVIISTQKNNYSVNGSFLNVEVNVEDDKYEIRHNKDTTELYKGTNLVCQLVPQD